MESQRKFCFLGNISAALQGNTIGGGELQIALLAKALAKTGHEVTIIDPYAPESITTQEGVRLIHIPDWNRGIRGIRLFSNRIPTLFKLLQKQNADYYYVRMRSFLHLVPYFTARHLKARFIQAIAQDMDIAGFSKQMIYEFETNKNYFKLFFVNFPSYIASNYTLRRADYILLQHSDQTPVYKHLKSKVVIFPNIIDLNAIHTKPGNEKDYFIHVGTLTLFKGSKKLFELIRILDSRIKIIIVGNPDDKESVHFFESLKEYPNVTVMGRLDHASTIQLIANAKALINTSIYEGFPNIFLEAWATGVPVVSLYSNPGKVIDRHHLGKYCNGDLLKMKNVIESGKIIETDKSMLIRYVEENHSLVGAAQKLTDIL